MKLISFKTLRSLCTDFIIFLIPLLLIFMAFPFLLRILSPFIAGFFLYLAAKPLKGFLARRGLPSSLCALFSLLIISALVFLFIRAVIVKLLLEIASLSESAEFIEKSALARIPQTAKSFISHSDLPSVIKTSTENYLPSLFETLKDYILRFAENLAGKILNLLKNIPSMLIWLFTAVFTTFFLLKEEDGITSFSKNFFGEKLCSFFIKAKKSFLSVAFSYLKAQLIIEGIIFVILLAGFFILDIKYAFLGAFATTLVDAIPILGTGAVLIPMAIINFIIGNKSLGWGLFALYGASLLARQLCEPKIIGSKLGIHPLATIFAMYSGMKIFGIAGLIFGPIVAIFMKTLLAERA